MERAVNPQTGEVVFLVDNQWVKPTQTAQNPQTGEMAYLVGNQWQVVPGIKPQAVDVPPLVSPEELLTPTEQQTASPSEMASAIGQRLIGGAKYIAGTEPEKRGSLIGDIVAGFERANVGAAGTFRAIAEAGAPLLDPITGKVLPENPLRRIASEFEKMGVESEARAKAKMPTESQDVLSSGVSSGIQSLAQNILALPMALLPGGQPAALALLSSSTGGQSYQEAREKGLSPQQAIPYAVSQASIEYATEIMPLTALISDINKKTGFGKMLLNQIVREVPGEQAATVLQDMNEWAILNPEKSFNQYLTERPSAAAQTLVATIVGAGGNVLVSKALQTGLEAIEQRPAPPTEEVRLEEKRVEPTIEGLPTRKGPAPAPKVETEDAITEAITPKKLGVPETREEALEFLNIFSKTLGEEFDEADRNEFLERWEKARAAEGLTPSEELESAGQGIQREVKAESPDTQTYIQKMLPVEVPVTDLKLSKDVPQFKSDANEQGVVERLGGKFEREGLAPIQVWRRNNGDLEVISGRHRLDLARRSGEQTIPAQIFNESDGFDAKRAAVMDAELNIRDEKGKVKDYVTYFKETKLPQDEAESRGLLARSVGKRAYTIANEGSEELITALRNEAITDEGAFVIAKNAPNNAKLQAVGIQAIQKGLGIGAAANKMQALKAMAGEADTSIDMFGFDSGALKEAEEMGKIADRKQREIGTRLAAISGAAKNPKLAKQEGIDIRDEAAVAQRVDELRQLKASWDNWPTNPELREEIRAEMRPAEAKAKPAPKVEVTAEKPVKPTKETQAEINRKRQEEQRKAAQEAKEAEKREEKAIADREVDLFKLQPTVQELEAAPTGDLFGAKDLLTQPPKRPPILDRAAKETGLFAEPEKIDERYVMELPVLLPGDFVGGFETLDEIPNTKSIPATFDNYAIIPGVRQVPFAAFEVQGKPVYGSTDERERTLKLADEIKKSGKIKPLIVVLDDKGLYVLEGGHRWDALRELKAQSFPAMVVIDKDEASTTKATKEEAKHLETVVKDTLKKLEDDFMIGDMVRVGNSPGVIVGIEGDYVRVHPDSADSPKAYRRVQKRLVTFVARPDTKSTVTLSKQQDQENKFGEQQGRLNADMAGLVQLWGENMYASNLADVAIKEILQNAFDAVKGATSSKKEPALYKSGNINIKIDSNTRTITISDDGRGMTPEIVQNAFFTIAGSDKSDLDPQERSGGFGLAKMGFMLGSKSLKLETIRDGVKVVVDTTSKEIANSNFKIVKSPAKKGEHGTSVSVVIPETYRKATTGEERSIWFPYAIDKVDPLQQPLIGPVNVDLEYTNYAGTDKLTLPIGKNFPLDSYQKFKVNFDWGSADVYFGIQRVDQPKQKVLSSGVYQFDQLFMLNQQERVPYNIIVNIKSNVEAKDIDYPFDNSRERFKGRLEKDVKALTSYIAQLARGNEMADLQETFKNIVSMPRTEVGKETAETSKKLKKSFEKREVEKFELPPIPQEVTVTGDFVIDTKGSVIVDVKKEEEKKRKESFKAETEAPIREEYMLDIPQDPRNPIFHNNTNLDVIKIGEKYGNPMQFFSELGTLMIEMKEALGKSNLYGYQLLQPQNLFFGGIAIDRKYGGVHIRVPYKAVLINPFYNWGAKTLFGVRGNIFTTMVHEIAHTADMGHGVGHNEQMVKIEQYLEDEGLADYFRDAILDILVRHESTFTAMREEYGKSTTQNIGKSLEDYDKSKSAAASRRVEPSGEGEDWFVSSGGGQERVEGVRASGRRDKESKIGGRAGEEVRDLLDRTNRINTPMLDHTPVKTVLLKSVQSGKELFKDGVEDPNALIRNMTGSMDRGILYLRNKNIWFGSGLNAADMAQYNGLIRNSEGIAIASVALENAISGGNIYAQVVMEGGIEWNDSLQNFVAVNKPYSMRNIYQEEAKLKKQLGNQTAQDLIQGYLEAKRSRSIQNEYYKRQEEMLNLETKLDGPLDPAQIKIVKKELEEAQKDFENIEIVFEKIAMSDETIDEFIAQDEKFPELRNIMDNWTQINQNLLRFWRDTNVFSEKRYNQLASIKDYVPWQRIMTMDEDPHSPVQATTKTMTNVGREKLFKKGFPKVSTTFIAKDGQKAFRIQPSSVVFATVNGVQVPKDKFVVDSDGKVQLNVPIKAGDTVIFEGVREIENIIDNMTRNVGMMVINGLRNYAGVRIASEYGTRNEDGKLKTYKRPDKDAGIFNVLIDGQRVNVQVADPLVAEAAIGMETMNLEAVKFFGALANITRRSITLSGTFQIKQVFKDAPTAALVTGVKRPDLLIGGVFKGFVTALTQSDPAYDILRKAGVGGFHSPARTPEAEVKRQIGIINKSTYDYVIYALDRFGDSADYAQRIAVFNRVMAETKAEQYKEILKKTGDKDLAKRLATGDEAAALWQARNVINYLHHGSGQIAQATVRMVPFMGAYANSIDVLTQSVANRSIKGVDRSKVWKRILTTGTLLSFNTLLYCMLLGADDDYWELDDDTRLRNFIVPFLRAPDGSMIMTPMNTTAAFFFKAIPELLYWKVTKSGTESEADWRRLLKAAGRAAVDTILGPTPLPPAIKTPFEIAINYDFFTGRPVIPRGLENEEAWQQYTSSTSELGKFLSAASGGFMSDKYRLLNPVEADHFVRGLFGSAGAMAQWSTNVIYEAATGDERRPAKTLRETPIVGAFVSQPVPRGKEDLFYDFKKSTDQAYETFMSLVNRGERDLAKEYLEKNSKMIGYHDYTNEVSTVLKEINSEIRRISELKIGEGSPLTSEGKRDRITTLQMQKNKILKDIQRFRNDAYTSQPAE